MFYKKAYCLVNLLLTATRAGSFDDKNMLINSLISSKILFFDERFFTKMHFEENRQISK